MKIYNYALIIITALLMSTPHFLNSAAASRKKLPSWMLRQFNEDLLNAAAQGDDDEVRASLKVGANVNAKDKYGLTALMHAGKFGRLQVVKTLLENGADANATDNGGHNALYWAQGRADLDQARANPALKARYDEIIRLLTEAMQQ